MTEVIVNNTHKYLLPDTFNELTNRQLCAIAPVLLKPTPSVEEKFSVAYYLCGFGTKYFNIRESLSDEAYQHFAKEIYDWVMPTFEFLYDKNTLTEQLIPELLVFKKLRLFGTQKLYGPKSNFENLTMAEFSDAETCLDNYEETKEDVWLNRFLAVLYRPGKPKADITDQRQPYNYFANDFNAELLKSIHPGIKSAVMLWYLGCRGQLVADFKALFKTKNEIAAHSKTSWTDIIHDLSGAKFGTIDQTGAQPVRVIFYELQLLHQKSTA